MRPRYMTAIRSATTRAAERSWVTNSTAMPSSRRSRPSRLSTVAASDTSSALVGSSHSSTSGGTTIAAGERDALALAARELRRASRCATSAGSPTSVSASATRSLARCAPRPSLAQPLADQLADRHPRRERRAGVLEHHLRAARPRRARRRPSSCFSRPATTRSSVDLPQPLSPTSATDSPRHDLEVDAAQRLELAAACRPPRSVNDFVDALDDERAVGRAAVVGAASAHCARPVGRGVVIASRSALAERGRTRRCRRACRPARAAGSGLVARGRRAARTAARTRSPAGGSRGSGGSPGSVGQLALAVGAQREPRPSSPTVYGWAGRVSTDVRRRRTRRAARRTSPRCGRRAATRRRGRG